MPLQARGICRMEMDQMEWMCYGPRSGEGLEGVGDVTLFPQSMWCMNTSPEQHPLAMFEPSSQAQHKAASRNEPKE